MVMYSNSNLLMSINRINSYCRLDLTQCRPVEIWFKFRGLCILKMKVLRRSLGEPQSLFGRFGEETTSILGSWFRAS
jgi:hypothetical protein